MPRLNLSKIYNAKISSSIALAVLCISRKIDENRRKMVAKIPLVPGFQAVVANQCNPGINVFRVLKCQLMAALSEGSNRMDNVESTSESMKFPAARLLGEKFSANSAVAGMVMRRISRIAGGEPSFDASVQGKNTFDANPF